MKGICDADLRGTVTGAIGTRIAYVLLAGGTGEAVRKAEGREAAEVFGTLAFFAAALGAEAVALGIDVADPKDALVGVLARFADLFGTRDREAGLLVLVAGKFGGAGCLVVTSFGADLVESAGGCENTDAGFAVKGTVFIAERS